MELSAELAARLDRLADDYVARLRNGERPSIGEYRRAAPEIASAITELFPALEAVELAALESEPPALPGFDVLDARAGGMGTVFRALDRRLDRVVAVKTVRRHLDSADGRARFEVEARAAARLDHEHIVRVHAFDPDHRPPFLVMQFVDGRPLDEACRGRGPRVIAEVLAKVCEAVEYAHEQGVVHRDLKPANVLVDDGGEPRITDFGLAALLGETAPDGGAPLGGTPAYVAPECLLDPAAVGPAADVYALGVTTYELLTGQLPFRAGDWAELRRRVLEDDPPLPAEIAPATPDELQRVCLRALERDPAHRYPSAGAMAEDLRRYLAGDEVLARPARYERELHGRLRNHLTDVDTWRTQGLLDTRGADRLSRPYRALLDADAAWTEFARRHPWETVLLRCGGWLILLSSLLWPAYYWQDLERGERVLALAVPFLLLNGAGWLQHRRGGGLTALALLTTGCLLLPITTAVTLTEFELLRALQAPELELFGVIHTEPVAGGRRPFEPSNVQLALSAAAFLGYAIVLLLVVRARLLALWVGVGAYLCHAATLLVCGMKRWLEIDRVAWTITCFVPLAAAFALATRIERRPPLRRFAAPLFAFFPVPMTALLSGIAVWGAREWLGARDDWTAPATQHWLMVNGAVWAVLATVLLPARRQYVRFWGAWFALLVPASLLVPTNVLFDEPPFAGTLGAAPLSVYALASLLISVGLIVLGTVRQRPALTLPGLIGLAAVVVRATERHFAGLLAWPLALLLTGTAAMLIGQWVAWRRRARPE